MSLILFFINTYFVLLLLALSGSKLVLFWEDGDEDGEGERERGREKEREKERERKREKEREREKKKEREWERNNQTEIMFFIKG